MVASPRVISASTFGAWLIKVNPAAHLPGGLVRRDVTATTSWCVRPTYRTGLIEAGQPVLLWISGRSDAHPAGIHAEGRTTGHAFRESADDDRPVRAERTVFKLLMPVDLHPLSPPVLRTELMAHPTLSRIEVLTMAAGSNPSFVTRQELAALRSDWPQVTVGA